MQIGNQCPGEREYHTFASGYCLNECTHQCLPASVLYHIQHKVQHDKHVNEYVSVTALLGCLRQLYLERTKDYFVCPQKSWYMLRGTILHNLLENPDFETQINDMRWYVYRMFKNGQASREDFEQRWINIEAQLADLAKALPAVSIPDWQAEVEYELPLGIINGKPRKLRGTIDVLRPQAQEIYDYKTIGDRGLSIIKDGAKQEHIMQFNLYRLLVERGYPVGQKESYKPFEVKRIRAFYMTMMQVAGTGSLLEEKTSYLVKDPAFHVNEVKREAVAERVDRVLKPGKKLLGASDDDYRESKKTKWKITYAIPEVPLLDLDELERFVHEKAPILFDAFDNGVMPPMCSPEMRAWKCADYCPDQIREACDAYNETTGEKRLVDIADSIPVES